jgi:CRP-like cAMP-binding protein
MIPIMSDDLMTAFERMAGREMALAQGHILFRADDPIRFVYVVVRGAVRLTRALPHGGELTLQHAAAGAVLAEASLFASYYHCNAVATEPTVLRVIDRQALDAALGADAGRARAWARHLALELRRARGQAEILSLKTVAERIAAWSAFHRRPLPPKGSWHLLALEIGVSPEALYRELARRRRADGGAAGPPSR